MTSTIFIAPALIALLPLLPSATAHMAFYSKSMYGAGADGQYEPMAGLPFNQWWFRGHAGETPAESTTLTAGGTLVADIACRAEHSAAFGNPTADACPNDSGAYHAGGTTDSQTGWEGNSESNLMGCALAIAYKSSATEVQKEDFTVFSIQENCVRQRETSFEIPSNLPSCPEGGCVCAWFWQGYNSANEMYMNGFKCNVEGGVATTNYPKPVAPSSGSISGPTQPFYWANEDGNIQDPGDGDLDAKPSYNSKWGWTNGAQTSAFSGSGGAASAGASGSSTGSSAAGASPSLGSNSASPSSGASGSAALGAASGSGAGYGSGTGAGVGAGSATKSGNLAAATGNAGNGAGAGVGSSPYGAETGEDATGLEGEEETEGSETGTATTPSTSAGGSSAGYGNGAGSGSGSTPASTSEDASTAAGGYGEEEGAAGAEAEEEAPEEYSAVQESSSGSSSSSSPSTSESAESETGNSSYGSGNRGSGRGGRHSGGWGNGRGQSEDTETETETESGSESAPIGQALVAESPSTTETEEQTGSGSGGEPGNLALNAKPSHSCTEHAKSTGEERKRKRSRLFKAAYSS
ncbi:uncharacterized protein L201_004799 [Kwoniella dendrophila CBS 6074]|uniref:Uncharacterized protein n=1 Tax=Kwoniella dendrophila CBS 6074 TaxID=1295534 RepID=A0AAX4JX93_9TREE